MFLDYHEVTGRDWCDDIEHDWNNSGEGRGSPPDPFYGYSPIENLPIRYQWGKWNLKGKSQNIVLPPSIFKQKKRTGEWLVHLETLMKIMKEKLKNERFI